MKQLTILMVMLLTAVIANAQLRFKQIETNDSTTTFVFKDEKMSKEAKTTFAILNNDGKDFVPVSIISKYENCANSYTITFPRQAVLNKTTVTLTINGKKYVENIWEHITEAAIRHYPYMNGSKVLIINDKE
ncbi:MAG: hypothetical protein NC453_22840 [Muribaculum sp.]|nr:hypothetical protein [Muribaculum sp.]